MIDKYREKYIYLLANKKGCVPAILKDTAQKPFSSKTPDGQPNMK